MSFIDPRERAAAHANTYSVDFYAEALKANLPTPLDLLQAQGDTLKLD